MRRLSRSFYARDTRAVARDLLGKLIVRRGRPAPARIVETEAYHGIDDAASHAFGGPTPRSAIMYGPPGYAYVYLVYGVWSCLNVVTGAERFPSAVLIRAAEIDGQGPRAAAGPGKLCRALGIDRTLNGADLVDGAELWIGADALEIDAADVRSGPRVGVDYAGEWAARPWRYWIAGCSSVSRLAAPSERAQAAGAAQPRRATLKRGAAARANARLPSPSEAGAPPAERANDDKRSERAQAAGAAQPRRATLERGAAERPGAAPPERANDEKKEAHAARGASPRRAGR